MGGFWKVWKIPYFFFEGFPREGLEKNKRIKWGGGVQTLKWKIPLYLFIFLTLPLLMLPKTYNIYAFGKGLHNIGGQD